MEGRIADIVGHPTSSSFDNVDALLCHISDPSIPGTHLHSRLLACTMTNAPPEPSCTFFTMQESLLH